MKHLLIYLLCSLVSIQAIAQKGISLSQIVKPGTKLIYSVESGDRRYSFVVTVRDLKNGSFDWEMGNPVTKSGAIAHTAAGLQNGTVLYNYFQPGALKLGDHTTSVWLSQKVASYFNKHTGEKPIAVSAYGPNKEALQMNTYTGSIPLEIKVNGETKTIQVGLAKPMIQSGKNWVPAAQDEFIQYNQELSLPIIIAMQLDFSIALQEIITK